LIQLRQRVTEPKQVATERKWAEGELKQSFEKRRSLKGAIHALASAVEMKDPHTAGHQRRVAGLACVIAKDMGLSDEKIAGICMAGMVHDVGKINVPAEVLSKAGSLNGTEFDLIKMHPQDGYNVLKEIEFPWPVAQIVLQHHERMDGSGYPQGLKGDDILLEARILAVADVVEAMSSHRPYRPALGIDKAMEEIRKNKGKLYDPDVVASCLRVCSEKSRSKSVSQKGTRRRRAMAQCKMPENIYPSVAYWCKYHPRRGLMTRK